LQVEDRYLDQQRPTINKNHPQEDRYLLTTVTAEQCRIKNHIW